MCIPRMRIKYPLFWWWLYYPYCYMPKYTKEKEIEFLEFRIKQLEKELEYARKRLEELKKA